MKNQFTWTDEAVATLRKLWADGLTGSVIAKELGVTRNSVIGKVHRLELENRPSPIPRRMPPKPLSVAIKRQPKLTGGGTTAAINALGKTVSSRPLPTYKPPAEYPGSLDIDILSLDGRTCRWPFGEGGAEPFTFCGQPTENPYASPYCCHHNQQAFSKAGRENLRRATFTLP